MDLILNNSTLKCLRTTRHFKYILLIGGFTLSHMFPRLFKYREIHTLTQGNVLYLALCHYDFQDRGRKSANETKYNMKKTFYPFTSVLSLMLLGCREVHLLSTKLGVFTPPEGLALYPILSFSADRL